MRRSYALAGLFLMVLAVGGCGSADTKKPNVASTVPTPAVVTKATYVGQVDALCKRYASDPAIAAIQSQVIHIEHENSGIEREIVKLAPLWERAAALRRTYDAQVAAVRQPSGSEASLERIAAAREGITATTQRIANLLGGHNFELPLYETDTKEKDQEEARLSTLEQEYGFKICGASAKSSSSTKVSSTPRESPASLRLGQSAIVGTIRITPTSLVKLSTSGEVVVWRVAIAVKNIGSQPVQVFCGGDATLTDTLGRTYEGKGVIGEGSEDCGEKLQPGLSGSSYRVEFKTPTNATPATLSLWGGSEYSEQARTWTVR